MPTQEEMLANLEHDFAIFRREVVTHTREIEEHSTMLLGLAYAQRQDIKSILGRLDEHTSYLETHTRILEEHTKLLNQILARLPEPR